MFAKNYFWNKKRMSQYDARLRKTQKEIRSYSHALRDGKIAQNIYTYIRVIKSYTRRLRVRNVNEQNCKKCNLFFHY